MLQYSSKLTVYSNKRFSFVLKNKNRRKVNLTGLPRGDFFLRGRGEGRLYALIVQEKGVQSSFPEPLTPSPVRFSSMPFVVGVWTFSGITHSQANPLDAWTPFWLKPSIILNNKLMSSKVDIAKSSFNRSFKIKLFKALEITNTSPSLLQKTKYAEVQLDIFCS